MLAWVIEIALTVRTNGELKVSAFSKSVPATAATTAPFASVFNIEDATPVIAKLVVVALVSVVLPAVRVPSVVLPALSEPKLAAVAKRFVDEARVE